ncbi:hypothetical protein G6F68_021545 [Rhizopus microsporus]|nr:hypothetical protein G6F68_021545 [Rhizopus microsporus]
MATWIDSSSENAELGSTKVRYVMWKVPMMLVNMADTTAAMIFTRTVGMPTASAASSRSRMAIRNSPNAMIT